MTNQTADDAMKRIFVMSHYDLSKADWITGRRAVRHRRHVNRVNRRGRRLRAWYRFRDAFRCIFRK